MNKFLNENLSFTLSVVIAGCFLLKYKKIIRDLADIQVGEGHLWFLFIVCFLVYLAILFLAKNFRKIIGGLSLASYSLAIPLTIYALFLALSTIVLLPDTYVLLGCLLVFSLLLLKKYSLAKDREQKQGGTWVYFAYILIFLWAGHVLLYFLEHNFNYNRRPYVDEGTFWYTAASNILQMGVTQAHRQPYGGGHHPFSIPFLSCLPLKVFGNSNPRGIFFYPLYIIVTLVVFLTSILNYRWLFLYFISALFAVFSDRSWISELMYRLVYGESFCVIFMLLSVYEIYQLSLENIISKSRVLFLSFFLGLAFLTKMPLVFTGPLFWSLMWVVLAKNRDKSQNVINWKVFIMSSMLLLIPKLIFWIFYAKHGFEAYQFQPSSVSLYNLHFNVWPGIVNDILSNSRWLIYIVLLSTIFAFLGGSILRLIVMSVWLFIAAIFIFFAYFPNAGAALGSSLRYLLPASLAIFYCGACGYEIVITKLMNAKAGRYKILLMVAICSLMIVLF